MTYAKVPYFLLSMNTFHSRLKSFFKKWPKTVELPRDINFYTSEAASCEDRKEATMAEKSLKVKT